MAREASDSPVSASESPSTKPPLRQGAAHLYIALSRTAPRSLQGNLHGNYHWSIVVAPSTPNTDGTDSTGISLYSINEAGHASYPFAPHSPTDPLSPTQQAMATHLPTHPSPNLSGSLNSQVHSIAHSMNNSPSQGHALMFASPMTSARTSGQFNPPPSLYTIQHSYSYSATTPSPNSRPSSVNLSHSHTIGHSHPYTYHHSPRNSLSLSSTRSPSSNSNAYPNANALTSSSVYNSKRSSLSSLPSTPPTLAHKSNVRLTSDTNFFGCISISKTPLASASALDLFLRLYSASDDSPSRFPEHDRWGCAGWVLRALGDLEEAGIIDIGGDVERVRQRVIALAMILESRRDAKDGGEGERRKGETEWKYVTVGGEKSVPILPLDL